MCVRYNENFQLPWFFQMSAEIEAFSDLKCVLMETGTERQM